MDNKINSIFTNLGFEEREIKIYLTLIRKESMTASQLSKETRIDRTTIYDVLDRLIDKGIVSFIIKNKIRHFAALKPKELLIYFKEKYSSLENIMPELIKISRQTKEQMSCELFQGKKGLKTVLKDLIASKKDYKAIGIREEYEKILGYFNEQGIIKLSEFKVKEFAIVDKNVKFKKIKHGIYRYLNKELNSPVTTLIYGDRVVFFIWVEPYYAIRIHNKAFSKTQEEYFEVLWKIAKS